ncbi:adenylosuccinate synthetase [Dictyobacter arantiisoli]|uniref:Adenylosuccinate synthetase n=1 Tax=Dictyobacter arantiisoli TaxID=2014874 RepID=A0A5A5THV2_9CHLR|nr:adenylosuccinate synthetase [Dictyobacter arantiisoli]
MIADLGFGDAGKGTMTDYLTRQTEAHTIVRYNGGPQAAHNVVTSAGQHHTFAQFGSGMLLPWTRTLLTNSMLINPLNMLKEARHLATLDIPNALARTQIAQQALIITPFQKTLNRLRELARGADRHGSCGEGIGECMADSLTYGQDILHAGDLYDRMSIRRKLTFIKDSKRAELDRLRPLLPALPAVQQECAIFSDKNCIEDCIDIYHHFASCVDIIDEKVIQNICNREGTLIFEGAQGVLLDEDFAFAPYSTWSHTTFANADAFLQTYNYEGEITRFGLLRAYATRHGAGPLPSEDPILTHTLPEAHNSWNDWQHSFRAGYFDLIAARYACRVIGKLDYLAITHLDRLPLFPACKITTAYRHTGHTDDLSGYFEHSDNRITGIQVHRPANLPHQEQLTRKLMACTPEYQILPKESNRANTQAAYLACIEAQLGIPVGLISTGPDERHKTCTPALHAS